MLSSALLTASFELAKQAENRMSGALDVGGDYWYENNPWRTRFFSFNASDTDSDASSQIGFRHDWPWVWPIVCLIAMTVGIHIVNFDISVAEMLFDRQSGHWAYGSHPVCGLIFRYGPIPGMVLGITSLVISILSLSLPKKIATGKWDSLRRGALFLWLLLLIGPGLIINYGFKAAWGRPRPSQCEEFGGRLHFSQACSIGTSPARNSSFPSGHASIAFYCMAPGFLLGRKSPRWSATFFVGGAVWGMIMGLIRMFQGGHFLSDIIWAGAIVYLTGVVLAKFVLSEDVVFGSS